MAEHEANTREDEVQQRTRSGRAVKVSTRYQKNVSGKIAKLFTPKSYHAAMEQDDAHKWKKAYDQEIDFLQTIENLHVAERPKGEVAVIPAMKIFEYKHDNVTGKMRHKVRIVARGDLQKYHATSSETFAPVASTEAIRLLFAIAAQENLVVRQADVSTAFLYGRRKEKIYLELPSGHSDKRGKEVIWTGNTAIYGLDDASRRWNDTIVLHLKEKGFKPRPYDSCIYTKWANNEIFLVVVYVNDMGYIGRDEDCIRDFEKKLQQKFKIKIKETSDKFLGYKVLREPGRIKLHQSNMIQDLSDKVEMSQGKEVAIPMEEKLILGPEGDIIEDRRLYQAIVGSLLYINGATRPDISFAVNLLSNFMSEPRKSHLTYAKRVVKYFHDTKDYCIEYNAGENINVQAQVDPDYANNKNDRRSVSGCMVCINESPVTWKIKTQKMVTLSSTESEYVRMSMATQEIIWMRRVLEFIRYTMEEPTKLCCDNQGAIKIARNPRSHGRVKHIDVREHFIRKKIKQEEVQLKYVPSKSMTADMLTKNLGRVKFRKFRDSILTMLSRENVNDRMISDNTLKLKQKSP